MVIRQRAAAQQVTEIMADFFCRVPLASALGAARLGAFLWSLWSGRYDGLDRAAERILYDDDERPDD